MSADNNTVAPIARPTPYYTHSTNSSRNEETGHNTDIRFGKQIGPRYIDLQLYRRNGGTELYVSSYVSYDAMVVLNAPSIHASKWHLYDSMDQQRCKAYGIKGSQFEDLVAAIKEEIPEDVADVWQEVMYLVCLITEEPLYNLISPHRENAYNSHKKAIFGPWGAEYKPFVPVKPDMGDLSPIQWLQRNWWIDGVGRVCVGDGPCYF
jgi:hypothetical protein